MKTAQMMVLVLPRFRWFAWGFGLSTLIFTLIDGYFSAGVVLMLLLGALTYPAELLNRRIIESQRLLDAEKHPCS